MESELRSIVDRMYSGFFPGRGPEKDIIVYLATKSIQNKDIWSTPVRPEEFITELKQYPRDDIIKAVMYLEDCGIIKRDGTRRIIPAVSVRIICELYLKNHPEITDVSIT
jgi:hypothetical protein